MYGTVRYDTDTDSLADKVKGVTSTVLVALLTSEPTAAENARLEDRRPEGGTKLVRE